MIAQPLDPLGLLHRLRRGGPGQQGKGSVPVRMPLDGGPDIVVGLPDQGRGLPRGEQLGLHRAGEDLHGDPVPVQVPDALVQVGEQHRVWVKGAALDPGHGPVGCVLRRVLCQMPVDGRAGKVLFCGDDSHGSAPFLCKVYYTLARRR